jgi:methionyl-tRNA formyltransferase
VKIVFMGTPSFAVPSLEKLVSNGYEVAAVLTQPDKPKGRGNKLSPPPVKEFAEKHGITVLQPPKIKASDSVAKLKELKPDLFITVAYGQLLSQEILDIPSLGCINVHGSLLPKYRGAAPIHWAVINGETKTGITTMYTDIGMDTGDMLLKKDIDINENMSVGELHDILSIIGAEVLEETLEELKKGTLKRIPQPSQEASSAPIIKKEVGQINWSKSSRNIHNLVRGTNPWPGAYSFYKGERIRIWKTILNNNIQAASTPGLIRKVSIEGIVIETGSGLLTVTEIQFDSSKRMRVEEYIRGHRIDEGEVLG